MNLHTLAGNPRLKGQLAHLCGGEGLSHAYLITGVPGSGRHALVQLMAQGALCHSGGRDAPCGSCPACKKVGASIHPDFISVGEEKPLSVGEVRSLRSDSYIRPNEGHRKIYVLWNSDKMNDSAQNALLKVLEEGPSYLLFLLVAQSPSGILETIRSRCSLLALDPVEGEIPPALAEKSAALLADIQREDELALLGTALSMEKLEREDFSLVMSQLQLLLVRAIPHSPNPRHLKKAAQLCTQMQEGSRQNVGVGQLFGWFCAGLYTP